MTNEKYNGWTNRETWATHLWITNDEGFYSYVEERRRAVWSMESKGPSRLGRFAYELEEFFKVHSADAQEGEASKEVLSMLFDIGSLWRVNWDEIAKALSSEDAK